MIMCKSVCLAFSMAFITVSSACCIFSLFFHLDWDVMSTDSEDRIHCVSRLFAVCGRGLPWAMVLGQNWLFFRDFTFLYLVFTEICASRASLNESITTSYWVCLKPNWAFSLNQQNISQVCQNKRCAQSHSLTHREWSLFSMWKLWPPCRGPPCPLLSQTFNSASLFSLPDWRVLALTHRNHVGPLQKVMWGGERKCERAGPAQTVIINSRNTRKEGLCWGNYTFWSVNSLTNSEAHF